jgi:hypothetical protein
VAPFWPLALLKYAVLAERAWPGEECKMAPTDRADVSFLLHTPIKIKIKIR